MHSKINSAKKALALLRGKEYVSDVALARHLGVHRCNINKWKVGVTVPRAHTLIMMQALLDFYAGFLELTLAYSERINQINKREKKRRAVRLKLNRKQRE